MTYCIKDFCCFNTAIYLLALENSNFRMVLEDDGSILDMDVLDDVFTHNEKIGPIMFLQNGEEWSRGIYFTLLLAELC